MNKIRVDLVTYDDVDWYAQVACTVTRAANKYDSPVALCTAVDKNRWDMNKVNEILKLPHSKIARFVDFTFIITGTSRRFLAQLMTHHIGISVMSGSLQYSDHSKQHLDDMFVTPYRLIGLDTRDIKDKYLQKQNACFEEYQRLREADIDNDTAGYTMPQSLRNVLFVKVNLEELKFIGNQRLCKRNTDETRYVVAKMIQEVVKVTGIDDSLFAPSCYEGPCPEGKYCCGRPEPMFKINDYLDDEFPKLK
jgi:thymidylate synthase (FAD)